MDDSKKLKTSSTINSSENLNIFSSESEKKLIVEDDERRSKPNFSRDDVIRARNSLDLTSLTGMETEDDIKNLCQKAKFVAAVCVYPQFVKLCSKYVLEMYPNPPKIASVANFPTGEFGLNKTLEDIELIKNSGGDEVDVVLPYQDFLNGYHKECKEFLSRVREASKPMILKVIIESGALKKADVIEKAANLCLEIGADFIKTSTGKSTISATPEAAEIITRTIKNHHSICGFKASGGIRTLEDAAIYMKITSSNLGEISPSNFRIGASSLLNEIEKYLLETDSNEGETQVNVSVTSDKY